MKALACLWILVHKLKESWLSIQHNGAIHCALELNVIFVYGLQPPPLKRLSPQICRPTMQPCPITPPVVP